MFIIAFMVVLIAKPDDSGSSIRIPLIIPKHGWPTSAWDANAPCHRCHGATTPLRADWQSDRHGNAEAGFTSRPWLLSAAFKKLPFASFAPYPRWTRGQLGRQWYARDGCLWGRVSRRGRSPALGKWGVVVQSQWAKLRLSDRQPTAARDNAAGCRPRSARRGWRPFTLQRSHTLNSPASSGRVSLRSQIWAQQFQKHTFHRLFHSWSWEGGELWKA